MLNTEICHQDSKSRWFQKNRCVFSPVVEEKLGLLYKQEMKGSLYL